MPNFDNFDAAKETYHNYIMRFTNYVTMKGVGTNKEYCAKLLLNSMGAKFFNMATALAVPKDRTRVRRVIEAFGKPFGTKDKCFFGAKHKFLSKYQNENQSVADFVSELLI